MNDVSKFDSWLTTDAVAALVIREHLMPVEGPDGVLFPATYAPAEDKKVFAGGYNIDPPDGDQNICLIDSVGSQANRIEPIFAKPEYIGLVPQVKVKAGEREVNLLEAGHRAGDALVRCTALQSELDAAFKAALKGDHSPLAKIAPTSLVFGVWDSRNTQAKLPRLVASTIRAFNVKRLRRSAQYNPAADYMKDKLLDEPEDNATRNSYAERGFVHVPATGSHCGVIATGGVRRDATLGLAALRLLNGGDGKSTLALRRYILGLSLVALTANAATYLRQGCNLVPDIDKPREFTIVYADGKREPANVTHADAITFAAKAREGFAVAKDQTVEFSKELAKQDVSGDDKSKIVKVKGAKGK
jgi:CRISPR-associated protein Csb1